MQNGNLLYWRLCCAGMVLLSILTFTPLVIPAGVYEPVVLGLPRSLWAGMLVACAMVLLIFIDSRVHPGREPEAREDA